MSTEERIAREQKLLESLGLSSLKNIAAIDIAIRPDKLPQVKVFIEYISENDLGPFVHHVAEHYELVPKDTGGADEH